MQRRKYITTVAAAGATVLAGCSAIPGMGNSGPKYEDVAVEDLMLPESAFPSDWTRDDSLNENFDAGFKSADGEIIILIAIKIHDSVDAAKDDYEQSVNEAGDVNELDFADEAFWSTGDQTAITLFRDSNVEGQAMGARQGGGEVVPAKNRSQKYARELHDHMQSV